MDIKKSTLPNYVKVNGVGFPNSFKADIIRSALQYVPRSDDVFLVSYPKCGTTWLQQIVHLLLHDGQPASDAQSYFGSIPFLEKEGGDSVRKMVRPGAIKTHLPFSMIPFSSAAKYIYIVRNPKDCCKSYYHHMTTYAPYQYKVTFDEYFEVFLDGDSHYGDYFDNVLSWYNERQRSNVLFLTYEEMQQDKTEGILKIAAFLGPDVLETFQNDNRKLEDVLKYSSVEFMKSINKFFEEYFSVSLELVRDGKVGQGVAALNQDQKDRFEKKIKARLFGTDLWYLWESLACL